MLYLSIQTGTLLSAKTYKTLNHLKLLFLSQNEIKYQQFYEPKRAVKKIVIESPQSIYINSLSLTSNLKCHQCHQQGNVGTIGAENDRIYPGQDVREGTLSGGHLGGDPEK